jgi:uncharacterized protein YukE
MANTITQQIQFELEQLREKLTSFQSTVDYLKSARKLVSQSVDKMQSTNEELTKNAHELSGTFDSLVSLNSSLVSFINKIDAINFPDRLDSIEHGFTELLGILVDLKKQIDHSINNLNKQIDKIDFNKKFKELSAEVAKVVGSNDSVTQSIANLDLPGSIANFEKAVTAKLEKSINELISNTARIASESTNKLQSLNIPTRMDKLDANIAGIMAALQNTLSRLENIERNLSDTIKDESEKQIDKQNAMNEKLIHQLSFLQNELSNISNKQKTNAYITWGLLLLAFLLIVLK